MIQGQTTTDCKLLIYWGFYQYVKMGAPVDSWNIFQCFITASDFIHIWIIKVLTNMRMK